MEVIAIFTGVHSPYIKGPASESAARLPRAANRDLDIEYIK
jgi:hypothetical protein